MSILEVKNLTHTYSGNTPFVNDAVRDVSFAVEKGGFIYFINGAEDYKADNTYGNVVKGALMHC